jgi:pimeloyl-ACP methyl ester carboxylesterase
VGPPVFRPEGALVFAFIALLFNLALAAAAFPTDVTVTTADKVPLKALYGSPSRSANGVLLVAGTGRGKEDWTALADKLYRSGAHVLAIDLRGQGANATAPLTPALAASMQHDVRAGVAWLKAHGATRVCIVGADLGANLGINVAADSPEVVSLVALSPGMDYQGVITNDAVKRYGGRPLLLVAAEDDVYAVRSARSLDALALGEHKLQVYPVGGRGTKLFSREPGLESVLLGWINTHWTVASGAASAQGLPLVNVPTRPIETSGPVRPDGAVGP